MFIKNGNQFNLVDLSGLLKSCFHNALSKKDPNIKKN